MLPKDITLKEQVEMLMAIDAARVAPGRDFSWPFASFQSELLNDQARIFEWSCEPGSEKLDGFVIARLGFDGECEIMHMACGLKGCGILMLEAWLNWAKQAKIKTVFLEFHENNLAAQKLYERMGFVKLSERAKYYRDGGRAILMSRSI